MTDDNISLKDDPRWVCSHCGDLALVNYQGLCRDCQPESTATFVEVCMAAAVGYGPELERRWRIG